MQSLWSKVGQAHRCGCRACKTAVNGSGRRVTTAPRRKPTFAEIFTAAYSSVFASAAVIDAVRKDERRREMDRQLGEARRELADLRAQNGPDDMTIESSIAHLTDSQMDDLWRSLKSIYKGRPHFKEIHKPATLRASELRAKLQREFYGCADDASIEALRYTNLEKLERAILFEESEPSIPRRDPKELKHLQCYSHSIVSLVEQMMSRAEARPKDALPSPSFGEAARLMDRGYPRYTFRRINPEKARSNTKQLNHANRLAINDPALGLKEKIGRVCYNLLISAYPPDMHSFNTLISNFDKHWGYRHFSEAVVSSFFYKSRMLPTPCTYAAILHHYKVTGNHGKFLRAIACITGLDQTTGAKFRRRHISNLEVDPALLRWAADGKKRTVGGDYVWEHAPLNQLVVEEILSGLLRFNMCDHAVSFFGSCMEAGVHITTRAVKQLLDECLVALDWKAAVHLIRELSRRREMWSSMMGRRDDGTVAYLIDRIYSLLDMIGLGTSGELRSERRLVNLDIRRKDLAAFMDKVLRTNLALPDSLVVSPVRGDVRMGGPSVASRSRLLQIESLDKELARVRKTTKSYESRFLKPDMPMEFRTSMAVHISNTALENTQRLSEEVEEALMAERVGQPQVDEGEMVEVVKGRGGDVPAMTPNHGRPRPAPATDELKQRGGLGPQREYNGFFGALVSRRTLLGAEEQQTW